MTLWKFITTKIFENILKTTKSVLLATTALAMTASLAAADVSLSGRASAGVLSNNTDSEV